MIPGILVSITRCVGRRIVPGTEEAKAEFQLFSSRQSLPGLV